MSMGAVIRSVITLPVAGLSGAYTWGLERHGGNGEGVKWCGSGVANVAMRLEVALPLAGVLKARVVWHVCG